MALDSQIPEPRAVVELADASADPRRLDPLGIWSAPRPGRVVFDVTDSAAGDVVLWRVALEGNASAALAELTARQARLDQTEGALDDAEVRLDDLMNQLESLARPAVAFDTNAAATDLGTLNSPEASLLVIVGMMQNPDRRVSFGLEQFLPWNIGDLVNQAQTVFQQLQQCVTYYAQVETILQGRFVAATVVGWSGAAETVWRSNVSPNEVAVHESALTLALRSRATMLRLCVIVCQFAIKVSAILATPVALPMLVPAILNFVEDIRKTLAAQPEPAGV